jgi:hypothetical protein
MELEFDEFALTISANNIEVPYGLSDEVLFLTVKKDLIALLANSDTSIQYFGYAPDNTADGQDELLTEGIFFRIIGYEKNLGVDLESSETEVLRAFHYLVENYAPFWTTIMVEEGETKKEITIALLYQDVFV